MSPSVGILWMAVELGSILVGMVSTPGGEAADSPVSSTAERNKLWRSLRAELVSSTLCTPRGFPGRVVDGP
jgi:hypothetical protein